MSKQKKFFSPDEVRKRGYKLLLYADNREHMRVLHRVRRLDSFKNSYVGCWHVQYDDFGKEIVSGHDKKHCHLILSFPNPRYWSGVLSALDISEQFCRPIGLERDTIEGGYVYLIHANAPDKEQYSVSDLWGSPDKVEAAEAAITAYKLRHISLSESMLAIRAWVNEQYGRIITYSDFVLWACSTPYVRTACSNSLVRELIKAHNCVVANAEARARGDEIRQSYERLQTMYDVDSWYRDSFGEEDLLADD